MLPSVHFRKHVAAQGRDDHSVSPDFQHPNHPPSIGGGRLCRCGELAAAVSRHGSHRICSFSAVHIQAFFRLFLTSLWRKWHLLVSYLVYPFSVFVASTNLSVSCHTHPGTEFCLCFGPAQTDCSPLSLFRPLVSPTHLRCCGTYLRACCSSVPIDTRSLRSLSSCSHGRLWIGGELCVCE